MLSLDVGGGKIRVVVGKSKQNSAVIEDYFELEAIDDTILDEGVPERLGGILRSALLERGLNETKCVVSASGTDIFFRRVTLPKANPRSLRGMAVQSLIGIPTVKDCYIDYIVEREHVSKGKKMLDLLICGMPKKLTAAYFAMVMAAGLTPHRMDARQNCIHRLLGSNASINGAAIAGKAILLLDAGNTLFSADIIVDAKSVFERTISIKRRSDDPFGDFDTQGLFSISGIKQPEVNKLYSRISEEANKMMQFSLTRTLKSPVTRVYIYGENSSDAELLLYLTDSLGVEAVALSEITGLKLADGYSGPGISHIFGLSAALLQ